MRYHLLPVRGTDIKGAELTALSDISVEQNKGRKHTKKKRNLSNTVNLSLIKEQTIHAGEQMYSFQRMVLEQLLCPQALKKKQKTKKENADTDLTFFTKSKSNGMQKVETSRK